jgi:transposase-like protein
MVNNSIESIIIMMNSLIKSNHINGIENFWSFAKRRLNHFNGIKDKDFYLCLKSMNFWMMNEVIFTQNYKLFKSSA